MARIPVWMDCDTGTDDAVAIMLAQSLSEIELIGISAVCGNTCIDNTFYNTIRVCGLAGSDAPVYRGAENPLIGKLTYAAAFHGENGLGNVELPIPGDAVIHSEKAWDALYCAACSIPGELRLVATGPLTNIAIAFAKYPDLPGILHSVLIMGGSTTNGNVTPAAEFNIHADPHAAESVFRTCRCVHMFGLNATLQQWLSAEELDAYAATGTRCGEFVYDCLQPALKSLSRIGLPGVTMHDSFPIMYLVHPELFKMESAGVHVETRGKLTLGKTVTDLYSDKQFDEKNALVCTEVDRASFNSILFERITALG